MLLCTSHVMRRHAVGRGRQLFEDFLAGHDSGPLSKPSSIAHFSIFTPDVVDWVWSSLARLVSCEAEELLKKQRSRDELHSALTSRLGKLPTIPDDESWATQSRKRRGTPLGMSCACKPLFLEILVFNVLQTIQAGSSEKSSGKEGGAQRLVRWTVAA